MTNQRAVNGFTLIELLTVLVLIGILAGLVAPSMGGYLQRQRTQRALDQLAADLALARLTAVREGRASTVSFGASGYDVRVRQADGSDRLLKQVDLAAQYPGTTLDADGELSFNSRGLVLELLDDRFVRAVGGAHRDSLFVSPAGRIYRAY